VRGCDVRIRRGAPWLLGDRRGFSQAGTVHKLQALYHFYFQHKVIGIFTIVVCALSNVAAFDDLQ